MTIHTYYIIIIAIGRVLMWSRNEAAGWGVFSDLVVCRVGSGLVGCYSNSMSVSHRVFSIESDVVDDGCLCPIIGGEVHQ
jgi:hypothetical protein